MKESKSIKKSIRLSKTVHDYIEDAEGNSFNDKLDNLIVYTIEEEPKLKMRLKELKNDISVLEKQIREKRTVLEKVKSIERYLDQATYGLSR